MVRSLAARATTIARAAPGGAGGPRAAPAARTARRSANHGHVPADFRSRSHVRYQPQSILEHSRSRAHGPRQHAGAAGTDLLLGAVATPSRDAEQLEDET